MQVKFIFTIKVVHLASFWKWGFLELGSGPQTPLYLKSEKKTWLTGDALPVFVYYIRGNDNNNKKENIYLAGFLKTLPTDGLFRSNSLFSAKNVAITKTKSATISFFSLLLLSSSSLLLWIFLFLLSFSFVSVILELIAHKKPAFWRLFTQNDGKFR